MTGEAEGQAEERGLAERANVVVTPALPKYGPSVVDRGSGVYLYGLDGKRYIDFASGIAVVNVGHCHPRVVEAATEQVAKLIHACVHVSWYPTYVALAEKLSEIVPDLGMAFFCNSGTEAVEAALKLARYVTRRPGFIAFQGAFHGRTLGAASVTGKAALRRHYEPLLPAVYQAPYPWCFRCSYGQERATCRFECVKFVEHMLETVIHPEDTAAVIIEPIVGEGGYHVAPDEFMLALRGLCRRHGILLIVDEVQSGIGRTGKMFAWEHIDGFMPDIMTLAKALASGFPIGAVLARPEIMGQWGQGAHGSTFGGNPVSCAAALATLEAIEAEGLVENAARMGEYMRDAITSLSARSGGIADVRGRGLMLAMEFVDSRGLPDAGRVKGIIREAEARGLIVIGGGLYANVLRIVPPLILTREQADEGLSILADVLRVVPQE